MGGDSSSSGGELEAGELVIDDAYTHLSKKKKKSKKSKKKKDKERDREKGSREKKHSRGGSEGKKNPPGETCFTYFKANTDWLVLSFHYMKLNFSFSAKQVISLEATPTLTAHPITALLGACMLWLHPPQPITIKALNRWARRRKRRRIRTETNMTRTR